MIMRRSRALFAADCPHYDAGSIERVLGLAVADEWKRKILSDNARALYGL